MTKLAVYIVVVEDTEADDMAVMTRTPAERIERIAGNLESVDVDILIDDVVLDHGNTDIAR